VKGNFEITLSFEILKEPTAQEAGAPGTGLRMVIQKKTPRENVATINLGVGAQDGSNFVSWQSLWNEEMGKPVRRIDSFPTQAKSGKLCLVRFGPHLYFGIAEGLDGVFEYRAKYDFGPEDLREVRIAAVTVAKMGLFDARVLDVRIRADGLTSKVEVAAPVAEAAAPLAKTAVLVTEEAAPGAEAATPARRGWPIAAVLIGGAFAFLFAIMVGVGFMRSRAATPFIAIPCPGCGRNLRVRTALAGKSAKCPRCGQVVRAPAPQ
jgi:hypothetical protein